ncbi:hypothetical protein [Streptomyces sp. MST-110588]|uniref:hypothetical protein n=1 Tax=Streptomyces sp. MST-110588 TaxID=2833628 RepID=UPI001F5C8CB5|nr:hypothetical protein [Streptomyces sp. MST-110588]UNO42193.1 hypothetical protein KGS77_25060 [Streptomyces sp. MST-110588]
MLITYAAVRETAATLARSLGEDWTLDPEAPADGAAHLICSDGRAISFRPIFGGATVQLWITGNAAPTLPAGASPAERAAHEAHVAMRLPEGRRYNKATTLVTDEEEEPAVIILRTLEDLLPAFEHKPRYVGHKPWIDLFDNALAAVTAERTPSPAAATRGEDPEPEAEAAPEPEAGPEPDSDAEVEPKAVSEAAPEVEPKPEPEPDGDSESAPAETASSLTDEQPGAAAARRPRKRTPRRRPKAGTN